MTDDTKPTKSETALREEKILEFWKENSIFDKTLTKESPNGEFVFYEGPPTANAAPALHHLEARAFKDVIPRYKTMQGFHVRRKGGWDTQGLPVELQIEKKLGLKSKKEIEAYGIAEFNHQCRESVWEYVGDWEKFTDRIGYWVDQKNPYVTYENSYIESLWNIVSEVNKKNLLYKDYKVVPWCTRCGTALSSHELAQGYADITDISVYIKFKVVSRENTYVLAWTTTPWTLPGNVGLAVGEDMTYVEVECEGVTLILNKERLSVIEGAKVLKEFPGKDLVGLEYEPLYPYLKTLATGEAKEKLQNAWKVYPADFVTTEDGTGVVHTAVMYGQEDFELGTKVGLPKFHLVSPDGTFIAGMDFLTGTYVRDEATAVEIIKDLAHRGLLFKKEKHKHSYPHCWRCKTALIYYARDSWYIRMSSLRGDLQKENEKINWEPSHIKEGRFGEWLRDLKDWAISRERYWGTPLPVWEGANGEKVVIGSIAQLKDRIGRRNTYTLLRHGQSESNMTDLVNSQSREGNGLTGLGKKQVTEAAEKLSRQKFDIIFASPFLRTKETAEMIATRLDLDQNAIVYDDRLVEIGGGEFEGKSWTEFWQHFNSIRERFEKSILGTEKCSDVQKRLMEFLYEVDAAHSGKNILIIGHSGPLNIMELASRGFSQNQIIENYYGDRGWQNAESKVCDFVALPHNENYELDLHRPYIDGVQLTDEKGNKLTRTKEVMDVWFDSGSMPFAQDHYPFENREWVEGAGYPADFIAEAIDQTRGWFYTLLAVGVLMDRGTPYKNVICLGHILDKEGKKMSKSLGNILSPWMLMDTYGVDALRLWMYSVNQPGDSKNFDEKTVDEIVKKVWNPLSNIYTLFATYENGVARIDPRTSTNVLDKWIVARLDELVSNTTKYLDSYKLFEPVRLMRDFVQDFSTWYVRRSRERFKGEEASEAISTTEYVLVELAKVLAPFAPFYADWLYGEVTKHARKESVHLEDWPVPPTLKINVSDTTNMADTANVIVMMQTVRGIVSKALELRQKAGIKVRQPLQNLKFKISNLKIDTDFLGIIKDEINVKEIVQDDSITEDVLLDTTLTDTLIEEGKVRDTIRAVQDWRKENNLKQGEKVSYTVPESEKEFFAHHADEIKKATNIEF